MGKAKSQILFFLVILVVTACYRPPEFSEVPTINFSKLELNDTSALVLEFEVRDGDGDIGLDSESVNPSDLDEPYHWLSWVYDSKGKLLTYSSENHSPPFYARPIELVNLKARNQFVPFYTFHPEDTTFSYDERQDIDFLYDAAGGQYFYSEQDPRGNGFSCDYELTPRSLLDRDTILIEIDDEVFGFFDDELLYVEDTIFVDRNPYYFNVHINLLIEQGGEFVPFDLEDCGIGYSSRFPIFKRGTFGRSLDAKILFAFADIDEDKNYTPLILTNEFANTPFKMEFYIFDRALNQSNVVTTPAFRVLDLRRAPLVAEN